MTVLRDEYLMSAPGEIPAPENPEAPASSAPSSPALRVVDAADEISALLAGASRPAEGPPPQPAPAPGPTPQPAPARGRGRPRNPDSRRSQAAQKANATRQAQRPHQAQPSAPGAPGARDPGADRLADARSYNLVFFGLASALLGPGAEPSSQERATCDHALRDYLMLHPELRPRPELVLFVAYGGWLSSRVVQEPTVRERVGVLASRLKGAGAAVLSKLRRRPSP